MLFFLINHIFTSNAGLIHQVTEAADKNQVDVDQTEQKEVDEVNLLLHMHFVEDENYTYHDTYQQNPKDLTILDVYKKYFDDNILKLFVPSMLYSCC